MWLSVEHRTRFEYDAPIVEAHTELRLKPAHRAGQRCSSFAMEMEPRGASVDEHLDRFANCVHSFDVLDQHSELVVTARSEVWTPERYEDDAPPSPLDRWDLLRESRYVPLDGSVAELAGEVAADGDGHATALALVAAVRASMTYERGTTNVHTRADEALADGRGVCQDFAHVLIGACRVHGVPARYVSGYLFDPRGTATARARRTRGWTCTTRRGGWLSLDPTHDTRADRALHPRRRRPRLRRRAADARRLPRDGRGVARRVRRRERALIAWRSGSTPTIRSPSPRPRRSAAAASWRCAGC